MQQHRVGLSGRRIAGWSLAGALVAGSLTAGAAPATAATGWVPISGTVTADGQPLSARLELHRQAPDGDGGVTFQHYRTLYLDGSSSSFSVPVPNGVYQLSVQDWSNGRYRTEWYDDAASQATAEEIVVDGTAVVLDEIELDLEQTITGRVTDAVGRPVRDVRVLAYDAASPGGIYRYSTYSDKHGRFDLRPIAGEYVLKFEDERGDYATEWYDDKPTAEGAAVIDHDGQEVVDIGEVRLSQGGSISGRVTDPAGAPLSSVGVELFDEAGDYRGNVRTDRAGRYSLPRLSVGSYAVSFYDYSDQFLPEFWNDAPNLESSTKIVVGRDQDVTGRDVVLAPRTTGELQGVDLTGTVVDVAGKPVRGVYVSAIDPTVASGFEHLDSAMTDRNGRYRFTGLDPASLEANGRNPGLSTFRILFEGPGVADDDLRYVSTYLGGSQSFPRSATVTVPAGGTATAPTTTLQQHAGIRGTLSGIQGPLDDGTVRLYDGDGRVVDDASLRRDGSYRFEDLLPARSYRVEFQGWDNSLQHALISSWWKRGASFATATPIVGRSGEWASDVSAVLTNQVTALTAPTIGGRPVVGGTLTATTGTWNLSAGSDWSFAWLRGGTVVGTGRTYRPTVADAGSRLTVRVTNIDASGFLHEMPMSVPSGDSSYERSGTASSAPTAVVRNTSRASATASYSARKKVVTITVRVAVPGTASPAGTVTVRDGRRTVKAGVRLVRGVAKVTVRKPKRGKRTYTASYSGTTAVLPASASATVRVR